MSPPIPEQPHPWPAVLSALVPGLGQALKRQPRQAGLIFLTGMALLAGTWGIGMVAGGGAAVLAFMLLALPWWALQSYDAFLPIPAPPARSGWLGLRPAARLAWSGAHDIRYLGGLFLLTAVTDFYIIVANPEYALTVFCSKPAGLWGVLAKAQSPTLHVLIGYGFLRLTRWSLFLYLAYAGFGLLNATANYACFGYGRVRTVFLVTLLAFTAYVVWRRDRFRSSDTGRAAL
jgi:hypothetical protein